MRPRPSILYLQGALFLGACVGSPPDPPDLPSRLSLEQEQFWAHLQPLCGNAYSGRIVEGAPGDSTLQSAALIMHVTECGEDRLAIPFHVGDDRSRTWVLTRTESGLRLKHDHRHEDGTDEEITQYGGDTFGAGAARRQEFFADSVTASLIPTAATNVWTLAIVPGELFVYSLRRAETNQHVRIEFDLTQPVAAPPPAWSREPASGSF